MSSAAQDTRSSRLDALILACATCFVVWFFACSISRDKEESADDAFITYIYARNVSEGHGLRYNSSDLEPTSGASSLLHVAVSAAAFELGLDPLAFTRALGIVCLLAIGAAFGLVGSALTRAPPWSCLLAGLAVVFAWGMGSDSAEHLASGMETMLFTAVHAFAVAWCAWVLGHDARPLGVARIAVGLAVLTLLVLSRPEGSLLAAAYIVVVFALRRARGNAGFDVRSMVPVAVPLVLVVVSLALWQRAYFGDFFANPYYVKTANKIFGNSGELLPGFETTLRFTWMRLLPAAVLVIALAMAARVPGEVLRRGFWLATPAVVMVASYAKVIHEMAGGYRYEYPMLVPFVGATILGLCALRVHSLAAFRGALVCGAVVVPLLATSSSPDLAIWLAHPRSVATTWWPKFESRQDALARLGQDLAHTELGQNATILLSGAGQVPYYSRLRALDWIGLNYTPLCGRDEMSIEAMWQHIDAQQPDLAFSILPPAAPGSTEAESDPNFRSAHVQRTLRGRGSALFEHWDQSKVAESFWREMCWLRDRTEFVTCYRLGDAWGDAWWVMVYVRRDSPHRDRLVEVLSRSQLADPDERTDLAFPFDPKSLRAN